MLKKIILSSAIALALTACDQAGQAQSVQTIQSKQENSMDIQQIQDQLALKRLVDTFSALADTKDVDAQMALFTEDAKVTSIMNGEVFGGSANIGKESISKAFKNYLDLFYTVYHINGQHIVEIKGDTATGINYCLVNLIAKKDGKDVITTHNIRYNDTYVKVNGNWLIKERVSDFMFTEVRTVEK